MLESSRSPTARDVISTLTYIWTHPSNRRARVRAIARAIAWQAFKYATGSYWDIRLTTNRALRCHPNSTSSSSVLYAHLFDYDEMHFLTRYLKTADNFLDVGANIGVYTLLASSVITQGIIHAFEPSALARSRLEENVRLNNLSNIQIHPVAVLDRRCDVFLTCGLDCANHIVAAAVQKIEKVDAVPLEEEVGGIEFSAGKMDIEGSELLALQGAKSMLARQNPPVWVIESNKASLRFGYTKKDLIGLLNAWGYVHVTYKADEDRLVWDQEGEIVSQNLLFIAKRFREQVQARLKTPVR